MIICQESKFIINKRISKYLVNWGGWSCFSSFNSPVQCINFWDDMSPCHYVTPSRKFSHCLHLSLFTLLLSVATICFSFSSSQNVIKTMFEMIVSCHNACDAHVLHLILDENVGSDTFWTNFVHHDVLWSSVWANNR